MDDRQVSYCRESMGGIAGNGPRRYRGGSSFASNRIIRDWEPLEKGSEQAEQKTRPKNMAETGKEKHPC